VNSLVATPPEYMKSPYFIFATLDNEDNNVEPVGTDEQQEQGTIDNSDETDDSDSTDDGSSGVASEQDNACPAVTIEGPSYIDENECPAPCPAITTESQADSIPQDCPQSTELTPDDLAGTTQQQQEQEAPGEQDVAPPQIQQGLTGENTQFEAQPPPGFNPFGP
jgi:hypothetical protein